MVVSDVTRIALGTGVSGFSFSLAPASATPLSASEHASPLAAPLSAPTQASPFGAPPVPAAPSAPDDQTPIALSSDFQRLKALEKEIFANLNAQNLTIIANPSAPKR